MIKAVCDVDGRTVVLLGLDRENITRLQDDKPIRFNAETLGIGNFTLAIAAAETTEELTRQLTTAGLAQRVTAVPEDTTPVMQPAGEQDPVDVRAIVAEVITSNRTAHEAYLHDPAMHHGVEVVIGTLGRTILALTRTRRFTRTELVELTRTIAVACSISGGPEDEQAIGRANSELFPDRPVPEGETQVRTELVLGIMNPDHRRSDSPTGLTPGGSRALTEALVGEGFEILDGPRRVRAVPADPRP